MAAVIAAAALLVARGPVAVEPAGESSIGAVPELSTTGQLTQDALDFGHVPMPESDRERFARMSQGEHGLELVSLARFDGGGPRLIGGSFEAPDGLGFTFRTQLDESARWEFTLQGSITTTVEGEGFSHRIYPGDWGSLWVEGLSDDTHCLAGVHAYPAYLAEQVLPVLMELSCEPERS